MEDNNNEEIFTTVCQDILWEDIRVGFSYILNFNRWPSKEEVEEFFNLVGETATKTRSLYETGVEEFIFLTPLKKFFPVTISVRGFPSPNSTFSFLLMFFSPELFLLEV